jgi:hypothetical protein
VIAKDAREHLAGVDVIHGAQPLSRFELAIEVTAF